jgi:hypothetical protein
MRSRRSDQQCFVVARAERHTYQAKMFSGLEGRCSRCAMTVKTMEPVGVEVSTLAPPRLSTRNAAPRVLRSSARVSMLTVERPRRSRVVMTRVSPSWSAAKARSNCGSVHEHPRRRGRRKVRRAERRRRGCRRPDGRSTGFWPIPVRSRSTYPRLVAWPGAVGGRGSDETSRNLRVARRRAERRSRARAMRHDVPIWSPGGGPVSWTVVRKTCVGQRPGSECPSAVRRRALEDRRSSTCLGTR